MAQKRMFDKAIIDTDRFMEMPMSGKALYFLLGMEADDEGFVSFKKVMRIHGGNQDDLGVLIAKKFVIAFDSGVVVITDWNKNNYLDKNRIRETEYQKEKKELLLTPNGEYVLNNGSTSIEEYRGVENTRENSLRESPSKPDSIQEEQDYTIHPTDDEDGYIYPITKKKPADKTFQMNANKLRQYFIDRCIEDLGTTPVIMAPMVYKLTKAAMDHHKLTWVELKNVVDEWFDNPIHKDKVNFAWMLGPMHLNKWRMDNPK